MNRRPAEGDRTGLLDLVDAYLDAAPRSGADTEEIGPFTLFLRRDPASWPYYARPSRRRPPGSAPPTPADVRAVRARQRELEVPQAFEWVHDRVPVLAEVAAAAGLAVTLHPLLVLQAENLVPATAIPVPRGTTLRLVGPGDPAVLAGSLVAELAFAAPGVGVGRAGAADLARRVAAATDADLARAGHSDARLAAGLTIQAVAEVDGQLLAVGWHQPVQGLPGGAGAPTAASEIVGVATLPEARRQGLGAAVTAALAADAQARGCDLVLLSAGDDAVAAVYQRVGFAVVGQVGAAEPAD